MRVIEGKLHTQLLELALKRAPKEAVGLILDDDEVIELTNQSESPENAFSASRDDIAMHLIARPHLDVEQVVLWHSHPKGGVGPSRIDMQNKTPLRYHLVVSIVNGDIVPSWY